MRQLLTAIVITDTRNQLSCRKLAFGLHNRPLPVNPMRLNAIQPWAFGRQLADEDAYSLLSFCFSVVCPNPALYRLGEVPRGIIPDNQQSFLPFFCQLPQHPVEKLGRKTRYGPPTNKPQPNLSAISSQQPITAHGLGVWIRLLSSLLYEPQWFCLSPTVHRRLSQTTPPESSSAGESHPRALTEPNVTLASHSARIVQPSTERTANGRRALAAGVRHVGASAEPVGDVPAVVCISAWPIGLS
jgi:hypothetical protein